MAFDFAESVKLNTLPKKMRESKENAFEVDAKKIN